MGTFFIAQKTIPSETCERLNQAHEQHGFELAKRLNVGNFLLYLYRKLDGEGGLFIETGPSSFACLVGQLLYRGASGERALRDYCADLAQGRLDDQRIIGQFAVIVKDQRGLRLLTDPLGFFHVYYNEAAGIAASSFWALLELLPKVTVEKAGVYEYAWNGTTFGGKTILKEIQRLPAHAAIVLDGELRLAKGAISRPITSSPAARKLESYVDEHAERLRRLFGELAGAFGERLHVSFSSGYDSRLILAGLGAAGLRPGLFVYGQDDDIDVKIARQIAAGEQLSLEVIDKGRMVKHDSATSTMRQKADFVLFDAWRVDGIFDDGSDALDRRRRHERGRIPLNGSLGEIYRNFFYIPDRSLTLKGVVDSFFSGYAPSACTDRFSVPDYVASLVRAFQNALGSDDERVSRSEIERLYPLIRGRYWTGRDVTLNLRFGRMFFPFMQAQLIDGTAEIPVRFKNYGLFEAHLIERLAPSVARYPSGYGHCFSEPPPLPYRSKTWLTLFRPPLLRRYSYRFRFAKPHPLPAYLGRGHLDRLVDSSMPYMRRYFHPERLHDPDAFNRVATMEYIFQRYGASEPA
jgi:asparagine synthase (glutamine-hydrolysing)